MIDVEIPIPVDVPNTEPLPLRDRVDRGRVDRGGYGQELNSRLSPLPTLPGEYGLCRAPIRKNAAGHALKEILRTGETGAVGLNREVAYAVVEGEVKLAEVVRRRGSLGSENVHISITVKVPDNAHIVEWCPDCLTHPRGRKVSGVLVPPTARNHVALPIVVDVSARNEEGLPRRKRVQKMRSPLVERDSVRLGQEHVDAWRAITEWFDQQINV